MYAIRRLPQQLFEGVSAGTFLHSNRLSSCCRRGKYPHSTESVPFLPFSLLIEGNIARKFFLTAPGVCYITSSTIIHKHSRNRVAPHGVLSRGHSAYEA